MPIVDMPLEKLKQYQGLNPARPITRRIGIALSNRCTIWTRGSS